MIRAVDQHDDRRIRPGLGQRREQRVALEAVLELAAAAGEQQEEGRAVLRRAGGDDLGFLDRPMKQAALYLEMLDLRAVAILRQRASQHERPDDETHQDRDHTDPHGLQIMSPRLP